MADHSFEELLAPNLYFDNEHGIEAAKIMPGEYYVTARDMFARDGAGLLRARLHARYEERNWRDEPLHAAQQRERSEQSPWRLGVLWRLCDGDTHQPVAEIWR